MIQAKISSDFGPIKRMAYTVTREMAPIYTLSVQKKDRGCGIAGSLIFRKIYDYIEHPDWPFQIKVVTPDDTLTFYQVQLLNEGYELDKVEQDRQYAFVCSGMSVQPHSGKFSTTFYDNG